MTIIKIWFKTFKNTTLYYIKLYWRYIASSIISKKQIIYFQNSNNYMFNISDY